MNPERTPILRTPQEKARPAASLSRVDFGSDEDRLVLKISQFPTNMVHTSTRIECSRAACSVQRAAWTGVGVA